MSDQKIVEKIMALELRRESFEEENKELKKEIERLRPRKNRYTISQVAEITNKTEKTIRAHIGSGKLRCFYPNSEYCIIKIDLDRYEQGLVPLRGKRMK